MWSASSRTVISTADRSQWPWPMRSSRRPGQAMRTSTPRASARTWGFWPTPPKTTVAVSPVAAARGSTTASTWLASSRVGTRTRDRAWRGRRLPPASRATSGRPKARVLPLPVRPRPSTSRPASVSGSVATWIGKGASMPEARSVAASTAGTPRSSNDGTSAASTGTRSWEGAGAGGAWPARRRSDRGGTTAGGRCGRRRARGWAGACGADLRTCSCWTSLRLGVTATEGGQRRSSAHAGPTMVPAPPA
jgi:hypothetical protein